MKVCQLFLLTRGYLVHKSIYSLLDGFRNIIWHIYARHICVLWRHMALSWGFLEREVVITMDLGNRHRPDIFLAERMLFCWSQAHSLFSESRITYVVYIAVFLSREPCALYLRQYHWLSNYLFYDVILILSKAVTFSLAVKRQQFIYLITTDQIEWENTPFVQHIFQNVKKSIFYASSYQ